MIAVSILAILLFSSAAAAASPANNRAGTATPIKHLVVIFQENVSFDHYFGTYPFALNPAGEPRFQASSDTPSVNGLSPALLTSNPNAANPQRLDRSQPITCDQDHTYTDEQKAFDHGLMDKFIESVSGGGCTDKTTVMDYYDGNTVTALWNYAQHFAMSDNSYSTTFGPSTPGLMNLVSGQTNGVVQIINGTGSETDGGNGTLSVIGDPDPIGDVCSAPTRNQV